MLLAVGLGAAASVYTILRSLSPSALPYPAADRLVVAQAGSRSWSPAMLESVTATSQVFDAVVGIQERAATIVTNTAQVVRLETVSASYFDLLGARPISGRVFGAGEDRRGTASAVAVISESLWRRQFDADPNVIGRRLQLDDHPLEIIGVMPSDFAGLIGRTDVWAPLASARWLSGDTGPERPTSRWFEVIARRRADVPLDVARTQFETEGRAAISPLPGRLIAADSRFTLTPLATARVPAVFPVAIRVLVIAVAAVLLLVIVNLISLQLVRTEERERELAIRLALGADLRQIGVMAARESAVVAAAAAAGALWLRPMLLSAISAIQPRSTSFGIVTSEALTAAAMRTDVGTIALIATAAIVGALPLAIVTVMRARRLRVERSLRATTQATSGLSAKRAWRSALIAMQAAIACAIICGGVVLSRSASALFSRARGYTMNDVVTGRIALPDSHYDDAAVPVFYERLIERLSTLPGVTSASIANCAPGAGRCRQSNIAAIDGAPMDARSQGNVGVHYVSAGHFSTIGATLSIGRGFGADDRRDSDRVAVISAPLAHLLWPGINPVGRTLELVSANASLKGARTVIGVVNPISFNADADTGLDVFLPASQAAWSSAVVFVRGRAGSSALTRMLADTVRSLDSTIPIDQPGPLEAPLAHSLSIERFLQTMLLSFGLIGMLLAGFGTYAMVAQTVARSRREIGVRIALGASPRHVRHLVAGRGLAIAIVGAVAGVAGGIWANALLRSFLHGVSTKDPWSLASGPVVTVLAVAAAVFLPAIRASRTNPVETMKLQ